MVCYDCKYASYKNDGTIYCDSRGETVYEAKECSRHDDRAYKTCGECKHWRGGGDYGTSCEKYYYVASTNAFRIACGEFEPIEMKQSFSVKQIFKDYLDGKEVDPNLLAAAQMAVNKQLGNPSLFEIMEWVNGTDSAGE